MHPLKHHYIPEFYLKRWANLPAPELCEFSRPHKLVKPKRVAPGGTGYVHRLYALRGFPEDLAQQVEERFFRVVDNGAAEALELLTNNGNSAKLTVKQRSAWSRFLVSILSRAPEDVETFREVWKEHLSYTPPEVEAEYQRGRGASDPATLADLIASRPLADQEQDFFEAYMGLMDNPSLGGKLNRHPFRVIDFPSEAVELLTSDRPIIRNHSGLAAPQGHMAIAIGPRRLFITAPDAGLLTAIERSNRRSLAREMNRLVVKQANKFAYGRTDENLEFVRKHFATANEPRVINRGMVNRTRQREAEQRTAKSSGDRHALLSSNTSKSKD